MDYKMISADDHLDLQYLPTDLWTKHLPKASPATVSHTLRSATGQGLGLATAKSGDAGPAHETKRFSQKHTSMRSTRARDEVYRLAQQGRAPQSQPAGGSGDSSRLSSTMQRRET